MSNSSVCGILDLPDEILVKILLHLDPIERLPVGYSCWRINDLVFRDKELLRKLDFTGTRQLTRASDIQRYFNDEDTYKKILAINVENVRAVIRLKGSIDQAINLVELKILGVWEFESAESLSYFLKPLVHLKRLSVNWPYPSNRASSDDPEWKQVLKEPFSRLTYLSLKMARYRNEFLLILQLFQQLEELRLSISKDKCAYGSLVHEELMKLNNLKVVRLIGSVNAGLLRWGIMCVIPDPAEWTDFHPTHSHSELYLEKNVEVCAQLSRVKEMPPPRNVRYYRETGFFDKDWPLVPVHLLGEVIRVTHIDAPKKFCCLSSFGFPSSQPCLLKIDEIKKLLKDPLYQISYLHFRHKIEKNCDAHLLASAFPNLTELVLSGISNRNPMSMPEKTETLYRRLRKKGSLASEEEHSDAKNTDSSFKMLVENTPHLKVLEISASNCEEDAQYWDLDALYLISGWKNLTVIRLYYIPITDGKFLIDIGKECQKLEEVTLGSLSLTEHKCYQSELLQMLQHCKNLRKLTIQHTNVDRLSEMVNILSNCSRLQDICLPGINGKCDPLELKSSIEKMLRQCQELKQFSIGRCYHWSYNGLRRDVNRIIRKLNRSDFHFNLARRI